MHQYSGFTLKPVTAAASILVASCAGSFQAHAGVGLGEGQDAFGKRIVVPTYFANSPRGDRESQTPEVIAAAERLHAAGAFSGSSALDTGTALRKFIDPLPLPDQPQTMADGQTERYLPVARPSKWINPQTGATSGDDYYEIAVVEFRQKLHSDLKNPTTLRGYVQIDHAASNGRAALPGSKAWPLRYPDGRAILIQATDAKGYAVFNADGSRSMVAALAVDQPHLYGPVIKARKGTPTRLKFLNLLPGGRAETSVDANGRTVVTRRNGDLFLPVDKSIAHAGTGPDGFTEFTQNRVNIHLHGGDTPWISDGTPHQWITSVDEADPLNPLSLPNQNVDPEFLPSFLRGASAVNVPDMPDPGPGAMTYYFPNGQSARMLWYHDHTIGITRLNVYAGIASTYLLGDEVDDALVQGGTVGGTSLQAVLPPAADTIPLVLTERTFVPADIALQDARWNTSAWGGESDSWFPHVYETVQDPAQLNGFNAVGRWHWGPWFWPVFPAMYDLPTGEYGDVTTTPEAWMDTAMVNGVAYPTLDVDPKVYRFQILNASNDRFMTFGLFLADERQPFTDPQTQVTRLTEVRMVPAGLPANPCADPKATRAVQADGSVCTPATWPTDSRPGGVPAPETQGPRLYQIANEGGLLPQVAEIDPVPINYNYDRGRITVLNVDTPALYLGNAERADVLADFSAYAGRTLIAYNDSPAPVPAGDPRYDYYTGAGDQSPSGGAEDTKVGYGPNTRTMMQIRVRPSRSDATGLAMLDAAAIARLKTEIPKAYQLAQERPVVGQADYNAAFGTSWGNVAAQNGQPSNYATIYTGSIKEPTFRYVPGAPNAGFNSVKVSAIGSGYTRAPSVGFSDASVGNESGATAQATLKISRVSITNPGSGYTMTPTVSIVAQAGGGAGAIAEATLAVDKVTISSGGAGYTSAPTVKFSAAPANGRTATGTAVIGGGKVIGVTITDPGTGYSAAPTVSFQGGGATTTARAGSTGRVDAVRLVAPDPKAPIVTDAAGNIVDLGSAGGGGYTDLTQVLVTFNGGTAPVGGTAATASASGSLFDITMTNYGQNYSSSTSVTLSGGGGSGASAVVDTANNGTPTGSNLVKTKAIHELFEPTFGRMNAILAVELPFTSALTQTTIPLAMIDPPTERFADGETQIWKITHNGVDTHPVHFHLLNVQLINRVGWDGFLSPPAANEVGWKETLKMNPLEDVIVAVRAKRPALPGFGVPNSVRPRDPSQPLGAAFGFTQIDPGTGMPQTVVNMLENFGWEYVWHCHILGHEENDFMRPIVFDAKEAVPLAPTGVTLLNGSAALGGTVAPDTPVTALRWNDAAQTEYQYLVEQAVDNGAWTTLGTALANADSYTLPAGMVLPANTTWQFRVTAIGANGSAASIGSIHAPPAVTMKAPTGLVSLGVTAITGNVPRVTLNWSDASNNETAFEVWRRPGGSSVAPTLVGTVSRTAAQGSATGGLVSFVDGNIAALAPAFGSSYEYSIVARLDAATASPPSLPLSVQIGTPAKAAVRNPPAPAVPANAFGSVTPLLTQASALRAATTGTNANTDNLLLNWSEESTNSNTAYAVQYRLCSTAVTPCLLWGAWTSATLAAPGGSANSTGAAFSITRQTLRNRPAQLQMRASNAIGSGSWSPAMDLILP